jgi:hypothetical protein
MHDLRIVATFFAFLSLLHLWGGGALGAGLRARRALPVVWGLLVGGVPLYFGIERLTQIPGFSEKPGILAGISIWPGIWLTWQVAILLTAALAVGLRLPRLRSFFLSQGMTTLMIGAGIMAAGAVIGAAIAQTGAEVLSLIAGGAGFLFGATWFGAGIRQLRGKL